MTLNIHVWWLQRVLRSFAILIHGDTLDSLSLRYAYYCYYDIYYAVFTIAFAINANMAIFISTQGTKAVRCDKSIHISFCNNGLTVT